MTARLRKLLAGLSETFWLVPGLMVTGGVLLASGLLRVDRAGLVPDWALNSPWLYNGGGTGARTLLGAVASSTIGVAGTVFTITITALSLAAGQMGPRLLRNFIHDRGNQVSLGVFLGTFAYALAVLRSVRTQEEGAFVPDISLTMAVLLAFVCVGTLVYFVGHMAGRINVDVVIKLVSDEVAASTERLLLDEPGDQPPPDSYWLGGAIVTDQRRGYLQELDNSGLADWAAERGASIRLLVRPGNYVFPGAPIAVVKPPTEGVEDAINDATALGGQRASSSDLEFSIRQLEEVAVRALSSGINDPHTAMSVLDRMGAALCDIARRHLPTGVTLREGRPALVFSATTYDGLVDSMFFMIRQNAAGTPSVLIRMLEVLQSVLCCEHDPARQRTLRRHADLVLEDAERTISTATDLNDVRQRHADFSRLQERGPGVYYRCAAS